MTAPIADTTVITHLLRHYAPAVTWFQSQTRHLNITPIVWMEVMEGAPNKSEQIRYKAILDRFDIIDNIPSDQRWAMEQAGGCGGCTFA